LFVNAKFRYCWLAWDLKRAVGLAALSFIFSPNRVDATKIMAQVKKGHLAASPQWWKHLRKIVKRQFRKRHRKAERGETINQKAW
jgi:hypothetical protein